MKRSCPTCNCEFPVGECPKCDKEENKHNHSEEEEAR